MITTEALCVASNKQDCFALSHGYIKSKLPPELKRQILRSRTIKMNKKKEMKL